MPTHPPILKELARDFLALGSWVFFILIFARAMIKPYRPFTDQIAIAGIILIITAILLKNKYDAYTSRALILMFFTVIFYQDNLFAWFARLAFIGIVISSYYLTKDNIKIIKGIIIGIITTAISYYLATFTINLF